MTDETLAKPFSMEKITMKIPTMLSAALLSFLTLAPSVVAQTTTVTETTTTMSSPGFTLPSGVRYVVVNPATGQVLGDYSSTMQVPVGYFLAEHSTGKVVATTDASGNLIAINAAPADQILVQIGERRTIIESQIAEALSKNMITVSEVAPLRAALEKIAADEAALRNSGRITVVQAAPLAYRLNVLSSQLRPMIKTVTYTPVMSDRLIVQDGAVVYATSDFVARRALMEQRIDTEYEAGRLTNRQVRDLKEHLVRIANLEVKRKRDGTLSESTKRSIEKRFNELTADLNEDIASTNRRRSNIGLKVD